MTDKVQKIRQEIERLKKESLEGKKDYYDYYDGVGDACDEILQFIDSLPEEPTGEAIKENYNERYKRIVQTEQFKDSYCGKSLGKEEPASEDLEEYAKKLAKGAALDKHNLIWMCKKGAEWQKQKDFQDFFGKAEEFLYLQLNNGSIECGNIERLIDDFKNYMQDESEN